MSIWRVDGIPGLDERDADFTATFRMVNVDTESAVTVTLTQEKNHPASDLVGAARSVAALLLRAAGAPDAPDTTVIGKGELN